MNQIPRALYTSEFREQAVKLALSGGVGVSEAASRLSVPMKTLANWVRSAKAGKLREVDKEQKPQAGLESELTRMAQMHALRPGTAGGETGDGGTRCP